MTSVTIVRTLIKTKSVFNAPVLCRLCEVTQGRQNLLQQNRHVASKTDVEETLQEYKEGNFEKLPHPDKLEHFRKIKPACEDLGTIQEGPQGPLKYKPPIGTHALPHPIWSEQELQDVRITHKDPEGFIDKSAYYSVQVMRKCFDFISGFSWGQRTERKWLKRIIFLETVAGVPGMVAAMTRHLHSLRRMQRDYGWIHTLLEEAENERMHLLTALQLKQPSMLFRGGVILTQGVFVSMFSLSYLVSPKFCHRFVGYLEEEAVKTYTKCLEDIERGSMQHWKTQLGPEVAISYWKMKTDATMKDVILAIRADEAHHRLVNHTLASMKETDYNPYKPGQ